MLNSNFAVGFNVTADVVYDNSFDLDYWIMGLQSGRIAAVEDAIKMQMDTVEKRNDQIKQLNELQQLVTTYQATFPSGEGQKPEATWGNLKTQIWGGGGPSHGKLVVQGTDGNWYGMNDNLIQSWLTASPGLDAGGRALLDALTKAWKLGIEIDLTNKGQVDATLSNIKSQVDSLSNQTQMDLTRLQSLNNKRTEGFDFLTNWLKKMADTHSGIIRNVS